MSSSFVSKFGVSRPSTTSPAPPVQMTPKFGVGDIIRPRGSNKRTITKVDIEGPGEYFYEYDNDGVRRFGRTIDKEAILIQKVAPAGGRKSRKSRKTRKSRRRRTHRRM